MASTPLHFLILLVARRRGVGPVGHVRGIKGSNNC
jgi:hypothetical protein